MLTDAQRRAKEKYKKDKVVRVVVELYPTDQDIIEKLKTLPSKQKYIKDLIRADIKETKQ